MDNKHRSKNNAGQSVQDAIGVAFAQIHQLGSIGQSPGIFPNGIGSVELEVGVAADSGFHIAIKIADASPIPLPRQLDAEKATVESDTDVHASFNAEGHHLVALIMEQDLKLHFPQTMKRIQKELDDGGRTLLQAATFPDDIRQSHPETKPFHFIDIPIQEGGPENPPLPAAPHIISKIAEFTAVLRRRGSTPQDRLDALSWLFHLFGDIHQPLHCAERISSLHPEGDRGGNSFALRGKARNLHSLWDSSVNFTSVPDVQVVQAILRTNPRRTLANELKETNVEEWARASYRIAKQYVYAPLREDPANPPRPSPSYLKKAQEIGRRQAALGGYRLADRLHEIFG
jgi:hypothetical protein